MYEFNTTLNLPFAAAMEKLRDALSSEGLGVVSEVDVQAVFKSKIDKDIPAYRILGACNPKLAERVLDAEPNAGVLLPCNIVVREVSAEQTTVVVMDPDAVLGLTDSDEPRQVAGDARAMLDRVIAKL